MRYLTDIPGYSAGEPNCTVCIVREPGFEEKLLNAVNRFACWLVLSGKLSTNEMASFISARSPDHSQSCLVSFVANTPPCCFTRPHKGNETVSFMPQLKGLPPYFYGNASKKVDEVAVGTNGLFQDLKFCF